MIKKHLMQGTVLKHSTLKNTIVKSTALAAALTASVFSSGIQAQDSKSYIFATATTGGTYYPVGVAVSTLTKVKLEPKHKISLSAISSAGSGENVKLLRENQAQFAILMGLYGSWAKTGEGPLSSAGPQKHLRSVTMLWPQVEHFLVNKEKVKSGTLQDLQSMEGTSFSIGKRNSGTEGANRYIFSQLGINPDEKFDLAFLGYGASADAFSNGKIEGMNTSAGVPVSAVTRTTASLGDNVQLLNVTPDELAKVNAKYPLWVPYTIPANTYPNQSKPVNTIAQSNFMAVRDDVSEEDVYLLTKAIYENLGFLKNIHKATSEMSLQTAINGLPVPLHPGAARYYREQGVKIPDALL